MAVPAIKTSAAVSTYSREKPWLLSEADCSGLDGLFAGISLSSLILTFADWVVDRRFAGKIFDEDHRLILT